MPWQIEGPIIAGDDVVALAMWTPLLLLALALGPAEIRPDALRAWTEGRRADAIEMATTDLARTPDDPQARATLAEWQIAVHRYRAALDVLRGSKVEHEPRVRALRALAAYRVGDYETALPLLSLDDIGEALMKVDALEALGRFDESDAALAKARALAPENDARLLACEGRRLLRIGRPAEAVSAFRRAVAVDAHDAEALFGLGRALIDSGARDEGLAVMKRQRELTPLLDALDFARRSVDLAPAHAPNHTALGDAQRALGRLDAAEHAYRTAAQLAQCAELPANALRHARLLAEDRRDTRAAVELLRTSAQRCPDARLWVRAGDLLRGMGQSSEALAAFEAARALRPSDVEIQKRIADLPR